MPRPAPPKKILELQAARLRLDNQIRQQEFDRRSGQLISVEDFHRTAAPMFQAMRKSILDAEWPTLDDRDKVLTDLSGIVEHFASMAEGAKKKKTSTTSPKRRGGQHGSLAPVRMP